MNDISAAWREYQSLPSSEWRKDFFCPETGGYLVTSWKRIAEAEKSNQETKKYERERHICLIYAKNGHRIKHLPDRKGNGEGTYDAICDHVKVELKKTSSTNNILKYAKRATKKQGAQTILFEFENWSNQYRDIVSELSRKGIHGYYFITRIEQIHSF